MKEEKGRWVAKSQAVRELGVSLSTLDRRIRRGEVEVEREGRRIRVLLHGPAQPSEAEPLRATEAQNLELTQRIKTLEAECDAVRFAATAIEAERHRLSRLVRVLGIVVLLMAALLALSTSVVVSGAVTLAP